MDQYTRLDSAERWMRDGLSVVDPPGLFASLETDMSEIQTLIRGLGQFGGRVTFTHVFVRAVAVVLSRRPDLHQLLSQNQRLSPGTVDIGLSVSGSLFVAPVVVIRDAARKTLVEIAEEVVAKTPVARAQQEELFQRIRRWGWLIPFGWARRLILRGVIKRLSVSRRDVGTFQVSCLANVDQFVPMLFTGTGILGVGRVQDRVVVRDGRPAVRPTVVLSCCADHKVWDGANAASFLNDLRQLLISPDVGSTLKTV